MRADITQNSRECCGEVAGTLGRRLDSGVLRLLQPVAGNVSLFALLVHQYIIIIMKAGNIILCAVVVILGGFGWMLLDMSGGFRSHPVAMPAQLSVALSSPKPVLVEFYADWCGPCQAVGPQVDKLATDLKGKAEVLRFNVDQHPDLARHYGVEGIPCFIAFKNGKESARQAGAIPPEMMKSMMGL